MRSIFFDNRWVGRRELGDGLTNGWDGYDKISLYLDRSIHPLTFDMVDNLCIFYRDQRQAKPRAEARHTRRCKTGSTWTKDGITLSWEM